MTSRSYSKAIEDQIQPGMTLWYAFFAVTGMDKTITKLFVFTPEEITNHPVKDLDKVQGKE